MLLAECPTVPHEELNWCGEYGAPGPSSAIRFVHMYNVVHRAGIPNRVGAVAGLR